MKKITLLAILLLGYVGIAQTCQDTTVTLDANGMASITIDDVLTSGPEYIVDQTGTFAPVDISVSGTEVSLGDDSMSGALPIGFTFNFFGDAKTQFQISSNGFLTFDLATTDNGCCSGDALPTTFEPGDMIAFAWEDLDPGNGGQPVENVVRYATLGTAPNRTLVVEFFNVDHFSNGDNVTTEVILYEGSDAIEIHTTTQPAPGNHTMGIQNAAGDTAFSVPGRNGQPWTATNDFASFVPVTYVVDITDFTCDDVGANTVTVQGQDANGANVGTPCTSTVTVQEAGGPIIECQNITVTLDDMGMATIEPRDLITNGSFDFTNALPAYVGTGNPQTVDLGIDGVSPAAVDLEGTIGTDYAIDNVSINVNHTFDGDLNITLESPSGTTLDLSSGNGGSGDNYTNTVFQDGAPSITTGSPPFTGTFQPEGGTFASAFDGEEVNGDWTLRVVDTFGDGGTLNDFQITFLESTLSVPTSCGSTDDIVLDISSFDCMSIGDNTVTVTATSSGGSTTCTPTVTIVPALTTNGPVDIFTGTGAGDESCATIVTYDEPTATADACASTNVTAVLTAGLASGEAFPVGTTTVEYSLQADNGFELDTYSFDVTISDTTSPVLDCPGDLIVGADDDGNYTIEDYTAGITDNCTADADLVSTQEPAAGTVVTEGSVTTITVTSTDEAGNVTECTFDLTVDSTLGTDDVALNNTISLFPNPTNGNITLRNGGNQILTQVTMIDANGRVVMNRDLSGAGTDTQLSISNLASGIYFARISSETATTVKRIVKN